MGWVWIAPWVVALPTNIMTPHFVVALIAANHPGGLQLLLPPQKSPILPSYVTNQGEGEGKEEKKIRREGKEEKQKNPLL